MQARGSNWVEAERDETSRGSHDVDIKAWKCSEQRRLGLSGPGIHTVEVTAEQDSCHTEAQARKACAPDIQKPGHASSTCSVWRHLYSLAA